MQSYEIMWNVLTVQKGNHQIYCTNFCPSLFSIICQLLKAILKNILHNVKSNKIHLDN